MFRAAKLWILWCSFTLPVGPVAEGASIRLYARLNMFFLGKEKLPEPYASHISDADRTQLGRLNPLDRAGHVAVGIVDEDGHESVLGWKPTPPSELASTHPAYGLSISRYLAWLTLGNEGEPSSVKGLFFNDADWALAGIRDTPFRTFFAEFPVLMKNVAAVGARSGDAFESKIPLPA